MIAINPDVLKVFGFWGSLLVIKVLTMMLLTGRQRYRKQVFANQEDIKTFKKAKVSYDDSDVERVRRAHLNDLENVVPWFIVTYLWLSTRPSPWLAAILIKSYVLSRIGHTAVYLLKMQPLRAILFFVGYGIVGYEAINTMYHYF